MDARHLLLAAALLPALALADAAVAPAQEASPYTQVRVDLSLVPGISVNAVAGGKVVNRLSLGILARSERLEGVSLGVVSHEAEEDVRGAQLEGVAAWAGGTVRGTQLTGAIGWIGGDLFGAQLTGGYSQVDGTVWGLQGSGGLNRAGTIRGWQLGTVNLATVVRGAQLGVVGIASEVRGLQLGVFAAGSQVRGAQLGTVALGNDVRGAQLSLVNVGGDVLGTQVGLINVASTVRGAQVGLINIAGAYQSGAPVGLLSVVRDGQVHAETWASESSWLNAGFKIGSKSVYSLFTVGMRPEIRPLRWSFGFGLGGHVPVGARFYVDVDLVGESIRYAAQAERGNMLGRLRAVVGYQLFPRLALFAGASANAALLFDPENQDLGFGPRRTIQIGRLPVMLFPGFVGGVRI